MDEVLNLGGLGERYIAAKPLISIGKAVKFDGQATDSGDCQRSAEELRGYSISFGSANDRSEGWIYICLLTLDDSILEPGIFSPRMPAMETN